MELAMQNNYAVSVACFEFDGWSRQLNEELKNKFASKINYTSIPANRKPLCPWLVSSLLSVLSKWVLILLPKNTFWLSVQCNKRSWLLLRAIKNIQGNYQLVVAHNPGSFYPALQFADKYKIPIGIDLEDYHPGESNHEKLNNYFKRLNRALLPHADFVTAASPCILKYSEKDLQDSLKNKQVVFNYFSSAEFVLPVYKTSNKLSLVWFSQNISFGRGLEQIIPVIKKMQQVELFLYGNCQPAFKEQWLSNCPNILLKGTLPQRELHRQLAQYDIGLALEPGKDLNNELALSNKMLAYYQGGLFIIASNTKAQAAFIQEHPLHGCCMDLQPTAIEQELSKCIEKIQTIRAASTSRFTAAQAYSWQNESKKILKLWEKPA